LAFSGVSDACTNGTDTDTQNSNTVRYQQAQTLEQYDTKALYCVLPLFANAATALKPASPERIIRDTVLGRAGLAGGIGEPSEGLGNGGSLNSVLLPFRKFALRIFGGILF
jgi:hypothetical protein